MSETVFPPPIPKPRGIADALPSGSWTTGYNPTGLHGFPGHKGHVIQVTGPPQEAQFSNAGYKQQCRCLRCGQEFIYADGEFLQEITDDSFLMAEERSVVATGQRLRHYRNILVREITNRSEAI